MTITAPQSTGVRDKLYIGGEWVTPAGGGTIEVSTRAPRSRSGRCPRERPEDVDRAVAAAQAGISILVAGARRAARRSACSDRPGSRRAGG